MTILCIASYEKGHEFLREAKRQGARVLLLTSEGLRHSAHWPGEAIDEIYYMPDVDGKWNRTDTLHAVSYLARTEEIERLTPLDDFDLELAAFLREHLRIPGMGETTTRYFRDKLAMRLQAAEAGIPVPDFIHVLNHRRVGEFMERIPAPWVLKPRFLAGAIGIRKVQAADEVWRIAGELGDEQSYYLLERYVPGDIFHVDSIVYEGAIRFAVASRYGRPPMDVSHGGGIFTTRMLERGSDDDRALAGMNARVLQAMGLKRGVSHTEFIKGREEGIIYFLETSARVGGAHIADMVEAGTGINLWAEWAKIEIAGGKAPYAPPERRPDNAGLVVSLARQKEPDTSAYSDAEIVWRMKKDHHMGLIVRSPDARRVDELLAGYTERVARDFQAVLPPRERPTE